MKLLIDNWKLILAVLAVVAITLLIETNRRLRADNERQSRNFANLTLQGQRELTLKADEFKKLNAEWKTKIDSVIKANNIKLRQVEKVEVIKTVFRDTGSTKIIYKDFIRLPDNRVKIPLEISSQCWGMRGEIQTTDPKATLIVTEKTATNSVQVLVIRKRFLGFLWLTRKTQLKAFSDCGEVDITRIDLQ